MYKLFTKQQATALLPVVDETLRDLQGAVHDIQAIRSELQTLSATSLKAQGRAEELKFLLSTVLSSKLELDRLGVYVPDLEHGLVDFPSRLGTEVVYLCWEQGEDAITHFHPLNQSAEARRPLPNDAGEGHLGELPPRPNASA